MKAAIYIGKPELEKDLRLAALIDALRSGGCDLYSVYGAEDVAEDTDMLLSVGGDGTFLSCAAIAGR